MSTTKAQKKVLQILQFLATLKYKLLGYLINFKLNNKEVILFIVNLKFYQYKK